MSALSAFFANPSYLQSLIQLVDGELSKNCREAAASIDLSEGEKATLARWLGDLRRICADYLGRKPPHDSVRGELVKKSVYKVLRNDVDFVTRCISVGVSYRNTEAKFNIKPNSYGPFSSAKNFIDLISVKFDQLEDAMVKDSERFVDARFVIVSDEHFQLLHSAIVDLGNGGEICSSDGLRHHYVLCTLQGLLQTLSGAPDADTFPFVL